MIVLPFLAGITSLLQLVFEGAALGALFGALFGGAISGGGEAITSYQEQGEVNRTVIEETVESGTRGAVDGAIEGAVFGGIFGLAGPAFHPIFAMIDDFFRSIFVWLDDAARGVGSAADDVFTGIKKTAKSIADWILGPIRRRINYGNAANFTTLPKGAGNKGYVYVMEDLSTPGRYKLGKSIDPPTRIKAVRSNTGLKQLDYTCIIETDDMKTLENRLFDEFKQQRRMDLVSGTTEIFILNAAQLAYACSG